MALATAAGLIIAIHSMQTNKIATHPQHTNSTVTNSLTGRIAIALPSLSSRALPNTCSYYACSTSPLYHKGLAR